jgi:GNAT superfamily N-acetyltransferase
MVTRVGGGWSVLNIVKDAVARWRGGEAPVGGSRDSGGDASGEESSTPYPGLRRRRPEDLGASVRLLKLVHLEDGYPVHWPDSPRDWLDGGEVEDAFVVERLRELLGHVAIVRVGEDATSALHWRELTGRQPSELGGVSRLFVRGRVRGEGVGSALLDAAADAIRARGRMPVLDVVSASSDALRLYDERGWQLLATYPWGAAEDGRHIHYYRGPA